MTFVRKPWPALIIALSLAGCSRPPQVAREAGATEAQQDYRQGEEYLRQGDWQKAALAFDRAVKADPGFAEGYAGLAYILALRRQDEKAVEYADLAVQKNRRSVIAQIYKGRIYAMVQPSGWFAAAIGALDAALELAPDNREALFYKAEALFRHDEPAPAAELFERLAAEDGAFRQEAADRLAHIHARQLAQPQTPAGKRIVGLAVLTRADLAELLMQEIDLQRMIARRNPKRAEQASGADKRIVDINGLPAAADIRAVVGLGVMDVFPDGKFRPHEKVQRVHLAMTLQQAMIRITGDRSLDTVFIGSPSVFPDVKPSHYAFNAVCLVTQKGMMQANALDGRFDLNAPANGIDALIAVHRLQKVLSGN